MRGRHLSWRGRFSHFLYRELTFLPKRLAVVTLLLLALYLLLLLRTDQQLRRTALGFVEARLQSALVADYERAKEPSSPFAPLRLEILRAKLQDEHPYWSDAEINAALQVALAAAAAPILPATPTPYPTTRMIVQADIMINALSNEQLAPPNAALAGAVGPIRDQQPTTTVITPTPAVLAVRLTDPVAPGSQPSTEAFALTSGPISQPQYGQTIVFVASPTAIHVVSTPFAIPSTPMLGEPLPSTATSGDRLEGTVSPEAATVTDPAIPPTSLPTASSTPTLMTATHLAASHPVASESATPSPSPTAPAIFSTVSQEAPPSLLTVTATVTPLILAPTPPTTTASSTPSPQLLVTSWPTPTLTASPPASPPPTLSLTPTRLPAVSGLTAYIEAEKVLLQWSPIAGASGGYNLYREEAIDSARGGRLNETPLTITGYTDTVLLDGRSHVYRVTAIDAQNQESPPSPAVIVTTADRTAPRAPGLLSLKLEGNQIQIRWQAGTEADLAGYRLYRSTDWPVDQALGAIHGDNLLTTPSYMDQVVLNGQTYHYIFTAVDQVGNESTPSIDAQMPTIDLTPPIAPTGLTATAHHQRINITWEANSESDLAGYRLYRSLTLPVDTTAPPIHSQPLLTAPFYHDEIGGEGGSYYYVVIAVDANQNSSPSSPALLATLE